VQFYSGTTAIGSPQTVASDAASLTTSALPVGSPDSLTAVYLPAGGGNYATSTSNPVTYTVQSLNSTTTTVGTPTPASPVTFGTSVTLGATVSSTADGTLTGTVQFYSGTTPIGTPQTVTSGAASLTTTALPVGTPDSLTAVYLPTGGNGFETSTSNPVTYTVSPASTTTTLGTPSPVSPQYVGSAVTLTATVTSTVSGTIAGSVQFYSGNTAIDLPRAVSAGSATLTTSALPVGSPDSLTAVYLPTGGGNYATSTSNPVTYTVQPLNSTTTTVGTPTPASPQLSGTAVTVSASVTSGVPGTLSGTVQFYSGNTAIGSPQTVSAGAASLTTTALPVGTDSLTAVYLPNTGNTYATSTSSPVTYTVQSTVTTPPAPPAGATSSQQASSASPNGTATATVSGLTASGSGTGALTVATYSGNPVAGTVSGGTGVYYDVALSSGNEFGSVSITITNLGPGGQSIDWWNGSAWVPFSNQTYDAATNSVTITVNATTSPTLAQLHGTQIAVSSNPAPSRGYWEVASDGGIFAFGGAGFYGSQGGKPLNSPIVGIAATPDGLGYWEVASDGGVFSFGDATFYGSEGGQRLNKPIVGIAATPSGHGYWLVASDGGVFSFGDATFYGSTGAITLNKPIVGITPTPTGNGYWEVASDGGIFAFGGATFYGSQGGQPLNKPIVGIAATNTGNGYWEVASDGGIFAFGDAGFFGSEGGQPLNKPIVGIAGA
jgi:Bacterial Ig-like domain (group 3)